MEEKVVNKKNKKTLLIVGILCFVAIISIVGYTYSYLQITASKEGVITGTAASLSLELNVTKVAPDTNKPLVPQLDSAISSAVLGTKGNCVDDNENAVCQVYEVKVKNTSNTAMKVTGKLELNAGSNPNLKWTLIDSYSDGMTSNPSLKSDIKKHEDAIITDNETYTSQQEKTYYIVVWISETTFAQADTGSFTGVVTFMDSTSVVSPALKTLRSLNLESSLGTGTPNFAKSSCSSGCDEATVGIYKTQDNDGDTYYFRGDVTNNYVKFGKYSKDSWFSVVEDYSNSLYFDDQTTCKDVWRSECYQIASANDDIYWRIIRINGDGTIRMIYDGTSAYNNGTTESRRNIGDFQIGSSGDISEIYGKLQNWYNRTNLSSYNNSIINSKIEVQEFSGEQDKYNYYNLYKAAHRVEDRTPTLKYNNTISKNMTLISVDELMLSGIKDDKSTQNYLYDNIYDTISYYGYETSAVVTEHFTSHVYRTDYPEPSRSVYSAVMKPVISIDASALQYGDGNPGNPFRMEA